MNGWTLAPDSHYRAGGDAKWRIGRDGTPVDTADAPAELRAWLDTLNAEHPHAPHGVILCECDACGNGACPVAVAAGRWDVVPDSRGRWCVAQANGCNERPHALSADAADDVAPHLAHLLHSFYHSEPGAVVRERERQAARELAERQARDAEHARRQAAERERRELLATVAENMITPTADSVAAMLPALKRLLAGTP